MLQLGDFVEVLDSTSYDKAVKSANVNVRYAKIVDITDTYATVELLRNGERLMVPFHRLRHLGVG